MVTASRDLNTMLRIAPRFDWGQEDAQRHYARTRFDRSGHCCSVCSIASGDWPCRARHVVPSSACTVTAAAGAAASSDQSSVIISVPQRSAAQNAEVRGEEPQQIVSLPSDRAGLASALQRELQRVGCYDREINGVWTTSSRMAMQTFLERVNAALPFDEPDVILLSLVQGYKGTACGRSCPTGKGAAHSEQCWPNPLRSAKFEPDEKSTDALNPLVTGSVPASTTSPPPALRASRAPPAPGVREVGTMASEPPKFVRKIFRTFQRGIAQLGFR